MKKILVYLVSAVFAVVVLSVLVYCIMGCRSECGKNFEETLNGAVYLKQPVPKEENEGKVVVVSGYIDILLEAMDAQYNRRFRSVSVERHLEHLEKLKGRRNTKYWSPVPDSSALFTGEAGIGGFKLDKSLIAELPKKSESIHKLSSKRKIVYNIADCDKQMTLVGIQRGSELFYESSLNLSAAYEGSLTKEQIAEIENNRASDDKKAYIMIFVITTVVAAVLYTMFMCVILFFFKDDDEKDAGKFGSGYKH